jgi:hypothetical protein
MALTYTGQRNLFGTLTNNAAPSNLTLGDTLINNADADILNYKHWDFLESSRYAYTVANQQYYAFPNYMDDDHVKSIYVTIATTNYVPKECPSRDYWNYLNESNIVYSDIPDWYFTADGRVGFYPVPSTGDGTAPNSNKITMEFELKRKNLSVADYTTGTIVTATNASRTIVGNGTSWTSKMAGYWMMINDSSTANTGDGVWYEIESVTNTTTLVLKRPYEGLSIAAGTSTYTIGQTSLLPEDFQILPVYRACELYFTSIQPDEGKAALYKKLYQEGIKRLEDSFSDRGTSPVIGSQEEPTLINPNLTISL